MTPLVASLRAAYAGKGYAFFESGDWNLNLFGIRADVDEAGEFDDHIGVAFKLCGHWELRLWPATTDPGARLLRHPINAKGAAILIPGQYRGAYRVGNHRGYQALVQRGKVSVYRDRNRDEILDWAGEGDEGYFGINIHRAKADGVTGDVGGYSAGCQVFQAIADFQELMGVARTAAQHWGPRITYTLFEATDFA